MLVKLLVKSKCANIYEYIFVTRSRWVPRACTTRGDEATTGGVRLRYQVKFAVPAVGRQQTWVMKVARLRHISNK